jgi:hypothetical protein
MYQRFSGIGDNTLVRFYDGKAWKDLVTEESPATVLVLSTDPRWLPAEQSVGQVTYKASGEMSERYAFRTECPRFFARSYKRPTVLETDWKVVELLEVFHSTALGTGSLQEGADAQLGSEQRTSHHACEDDNADAAAIEDRLQRAFHCQAPSPTYPAVCGVLLSERLCALPHQHDTVRTALATDRAAALIDKVYFDAPDDHTQMERVRKLLEQMPYRLERLEPIGARRLAGHLFHALVRDVVDGWKPEHDQHPPPRILALAAVAKCQLAFERGELSDRRACPVREVTAGLGDTGDADSLASHLLVCAARDGKPAEHGFAELDHALDACAMMIADRWPHSASDVGNLRALLRAAETGDDAAVFANAVEGETLAPLKAALRALALATTGSMSIDRLDQLGLSAERLDQINPMPTDVTDRWDLGIGATLVGGVQRPLNGTPPASFQGPVGLPISFAYQHIANPGVFFSASPFDPGQYLSVGPGGSIRSPNGLDGVSPTVTIGLRWGTSIPVLVAVAAGLDRPATSDRAAFGALTVGTFLPVVSLRKDLKQ